MKGLLCYLKNIVLDGLTGVLIPHSEGKCSWRNFCPLCNHYISQESRLAEARDLTFCTHKQGDYCHMVLNAPRYLR